MWAAVLLQAKDDVDGLPIGSRDYHEAAAFLTGETRYWRERREFVADRAGVHEGDLRRAGRAWVIARRRAEGLPDHEPGPTRPEPPPPEPEPLPAPLVIPPALQRALLEAQRRKPREPGRNPFHPASKRR